MSDSISNLIFIPPTSDKETFIRAVVRSLALPNGTIGVTRPMHGYFSTEHVIDAMLAASPEELQHYILYGELGTIASEVSVYGVYSIATLLIVTIRDWGAFGDPFKDDTKDPAYIDLLAHDYVSLCHNVRASFAPLGFTNTSLIAEDLQRFTGDPLDEYVRNSGNTWLTYLNNETFPVWFDMYDKTPALRKLIRLASGAKVCFGPGYSPWIDNADLDKHFIWVRNSLQKHLDIVGTNDLVEIMQSLVNQVPARPADNAIFELREQYSARQQQVHMQIEAIRLLWATALQRPGLVSINHVLGDHTLDEVFNTGDITQVSEAIVPIVADHGHEWCLYTEQGDFDFAAPDWSGPVGLWTRVVALQRAAQEHPFEGKPPRVVLVAWRDLSTRVREAVQAQGVTIVASTQLAPLLTLE